MAHGSGKRRGHAILLAERHYRIGSRHAFGHAVAHLGSFLNAQTLAQIGTERVVAAQRGSAGGDQVTYASQTGERLRIGACRLAQGSQFG